MSARGLGLTMLGAVLLLPMGLGGAQAAPRRDVVVGMVLEPPGLDPTTGAAAAIGEIVHYNILEGLTKVDENGTVSPLLATSWTISPDRKTYTFKLRHGVTFSNGKPFDASDVKFTFTRDGAPGSLNKNHDRFQNMAAIATPDPDTIVITLKEPNPFLLFNLGEDTAVILEPASAAHDATDPIGTGPFKLENWVKGSSVTLTRWPGYRDNGAIKLDKVTFRFISDPAAEVAAILSGDVDVFPTFNNLDALPEIKANPNFVVQVGTTQGKTIIALNNGRKPFNDIRVRRAVAYAIDRKAIIDGAMDGYGVPIGSHFAPNQPGYVDLTGMYPYDPAKAKALLKEAGYPNGFDTTLKLPPPDYARRGGEIVAAELAKVGIRAKIENVEWAQWLDGTYKKHDYDMTIVSHVEPLDMHIYTDKNYYFQYDSPAYRALYAKIATAGTLAERNQDMEAVQRKIAQDCVNAFLFVLPRVSVIHVGLKGIWVNAPIFVNDMTAVHWE